MSRHSKNNTAHSIFTQGEKQKVDGQGWGTSKQRLGKESFKQFSACSICLKLAENPISCHKGHLFCKECILKNIHHQQMQYKEQLQEWHKHNSSKLARQQKKDSELSTKKFLAFQKLENSEVGKAEYEKFEEERKYKYLSEESRQLAKVKDILQSKDKKMLNKSEMLEKNYWIPETTPAEQEKQVKKPKKHFFCPESKHEIKKKKLIVLDVKSDAESGLFLCEGCSNSIIHHAAYLLFCGHLFCTDCLNPEQNACLKCSKPFNWHKVVHMAKSGTMFSAHNQVEAKIFNPVFQC